MRSTKSLPEKLRVPRSIPNREDAIREIKLHAFADAGFTGVAAVVYAHVVSEKGSQHGVTDSKGSNITKGSHNPEI